MVLVLIGGLRGSGKELAGAEKQFIEQLSLPQARRFTSAYAQTPDVFLSFASLLTGRYTTSVPICGRVNGRQASQNNRWCHQIPQEIPSLPEVLSHYGYRTLLLNSRFQGAEIFSREFQQHGDSGPTNQLATTWQYLAQQSQRWWQSNAQHPRLLVVVTTDLVLETRTDLHQSLDVARPQDPRKGIGLTLWGDRPDHTRQQYQQRSAEIGGHIAKLLQPLKADKPIIVVGGLHGISLVENTPFPRQPVSALSSHTLLDRTLRVPLLVHGPGITPAAQHQPVELVDILPTLLAQAGAKNPAGISGWNLLSKNKDPDPVAYSQFGDMRSLRSGPFLLTYRGFVHGAGTLDPRIAEGLNWAMSRERHKLFLHQVEQDPMQRNNVSHNDPQQFLNIYQQLIQREAKLATPPPERLTPDRLQKIRLSAGQGYW